MKRIQAMKLKHYAWIFFFFALFACNKTQQCVLDGECIATTSGATFEITADSQAIVDQNFQVVVRAIDASSENTVKGFNDELAWSVVGTGSITAITPAGEWKNGQRTYTAKYHVVLGGSGTESIALTAVSEKSKAVRGTSNSILIRPMASLARFNISVPTTAVAGENFTITITAIGGDNQTFTSYNGQVTLAASSSTGTFTSSSPITNFVSGVATTSVSYSAISGGIQIKVKDATAGVETLSSAVQITNNSTIDNNLSLMAIPLKTDTIRLAWNKIANANGYLVEEDTGSGTYTTLATLGATKFFYHHTSLAANTLYKYRVTAQDASLNPLRQGTAERTTPTANCGTTVSANITSLTTWDTSNDPICITASITISDQVNIERGTIILIDPGKRITVASGGALVTGETGDGLTVFTTSNTSDPLVRHSGIAFSAGTGTNFDAGTDDYLNGSVLRNIYFDYATHADTSPIHAADNLLVSNSIFRNNYNNTAANGLAGVLRLNGAGNSVVRNSLFQNNTGYTGGAIYAQTGNIKLISNLFENNEATWTGGGAVYVGFSSSVALQNNVFKRNQTAGKGGGVLFDSEPASFTGNEFIKNMSTSHGGGAYVIYGKVEHNYFYSNQAMNGGGLAGEGKAGGTPLESRHNYFIQNVATTGGGGIYKASGPSTYYNTFSYYDYYEGNTAGAKGGAFWGNGESGDKIELKNIYATSNTAVNEGGGVYLGETVISASSIIADSSIFSNTGAAGSQNAYLSLNGSSNPYLHISQIYFGVGIADCTAAKVTGAIECPSTGAGFKSDAAYPFCADTQPGVSNPTGCVGPNWEKPQ